MEGIHTRDHVHHGLITEKPNPGILSKDIAKILM